LVASIARGRRRLDELVTDAAASAESPALSPAISFASRGGSARAFAVRALTAAAAPLIKSYADALERYRSGEVKYVKLLDGGLVDNFGLSGFTIARLASSTPFGPLAPQEAVKLRRFLFLVVDSGRAPSGPWAQTVSGPTGVDLIMAASDTATGAGALGSYSTFDETMGDWQDELVRWRCGLSEAERAATLLLRIC
jgi:NTE family protein